MKEYPLDFLHGMPVRAINVLRMLLGDTPITPEAVSNLSMKYLLNIDNIGKKTVTEIRRRLRNYGLDLRDTPEDRTARMDAEKSSMGRCPKCGYEFIYKVQLKHPW